MSEGRHGADPLVGASIAGRYRVVSLIARGGMGKVYRAEQSALGRVCALKVVVPGEQAERDPEFFKRFSREAATAAKLTHPNSVTIFDYGKDDERELYFIAMEYLDGLTLHRVVHDQGAVPEERANRVAQQICRSLMEAHALGLVHRDLKPGNVLLMDRGDERDFVKVLDFGLVKDVTAQGEDLTQTGTFMGSPKYTAPEQVMGGDITPRVDIYSLGVVLFEMLTGKPPFDKRVNTATLMAHVNEPVPPIAERNPDAFVSPEMEAVVRRCLEKNPDKRYRSMKEVLVALKQAAGEPIESADALRASLSDQPVPSRPSLTPVPSGSSPRLAAARGLAGDSLAPPQSPSSTMMTPQVPARRRSWSMLAIGFGTAIAFGGSMFLVGRSKTPSMSTPKLELVVPIAAPAAAGTVTVSDPAAGIRLVRIESDPPGARVTDRGTEVCMATPCQIVLRGEGVHAEYRLNLTRSGYKPALLVVAPNDETASIQLEAAGGEAQAAAPQGPSAAPEAAPSAAPGAAPSEPPPAETAAATPAAVAALEALKSAPAETAAAPAATAAAAPAVMHFQEGMTRPVAIAPPSPVYSREAREAKVQGTVIAKCVVTTAGTLSGCRIVKGLPHMDKPVLAALAAARYRPVTYQGKPVNVDYAITLKLVPP